MSICVRLDPSKSVFWASVLKESLTKGFMSRKSAEKMAGRLGFVAYAVLGPLGANRVRHIYAHAMAPTDSPITDQLRTELEWWLSYLSENPPVKVRIGPCLPKPVVLYTDAEGNGGLGAVLVSDSQCLSMMSDVKHLSMPKLKARKTQIVPYEAVAITVAATKFKRHLLSRDVIFLADNQTVLSCVKKGKSRVPDVHELIHDTLSVFESCHARVFAYWVPSALNISDLPSRGEDVPFAELV